MLDFIEFLLNVLNVGELFSRTGEWMLAQFNRHSSVFAECAVGLLVWAAGIALVNAAAVRVTSPA